MELLTLSKSSSNMQYGAGFLKKTLFFLENNNGWAMGYQFNPNPNPPENITNEISINNKKQHPTLFLV